MTTNYKKAGDILPSSRQGIRQPFTLLNQRNLGIISENLFRIFKLKYGIMVLQLDPPYVVAMRLDQPTPKSGTTGSIKTDSKLTGAPRLLQVAMHA